MSDWLPEDLAANGHPYRPPRAFAQGGVEACLFPAAAAADAATQVGDLIQARADGSAVLADAALGIEASGVCVCVRWAASIVWSAEAVMWLAMEDGGAGGGLARLFLGDGGKAVFAPPAGGLIQRVGMVIGYDAAKNLYRVRLAPEPGASLGG